jgi:ABC-type multidrug transport system ATPase subunit
MEEHGEKQLSSISKAYLGQDDPVAAFGHLYPFEFLSLTALLYKAEPVKAKELYYFTKELLCSGDQKLKNCATEEQKVLNPFFETRIMSLSGGQRRILSIAATFLRDPQLLLLDEPLSGLDSVSGLHVMSALKSLAELRHCSALITVHQPSEEIVSHFKRIVELDAGKVVLQESVVNPRRTVHLIDTYLLKSHEDSQRNAIREGSSRSLLLSVSDDFVRTPDSSFLMSHRTGGSSHLIIQALEDITETNDESDPSKDWGHERRHGLKHDSVQATEVNKNMVVTVVEQVSPMTQRLCRNGNELTGCITVVVTFSLFAAVFSLDDGSYVQIVVATSVMIAVPALLFADKIIDYNEAWVAHKFELDDKRVSPASFQTSTALCTYPCPLVSSILATVVAYAILGWPWSTLLNHVLFVGVYLLVALQFGRALCVLFLGNIGIVMEAYTATLLISAVFSSLFVSSSKFPESLHFLFRLSISFWGLSGSVLHIFHDDNYNVDRSCFDFFSCVLSDGSVAGRVFGFSPLSNSYRALGVLTLVFVCLVFVESFLLYARCTGVACPKCHHTPSNPGSSLTTPNSRASHRIGVAGVRHRISDDESARIDAF